MKVLLGSLIIVAASLAAMAQQKAPKALTELVATTEKVVKGAPFSCEAVSESFQTLADGNRITRTTSNKIFRDSLGRFRREGLANPGGTLGASFELQPTIFILDPVEGFKYYVNSNSKTVKKFTFRIPAAIKATSGGTYVYQRGQAVSPEEYAAAIKKYETAIKAAQDENNAARTAVREVQRERLATTEGKALSGQMAIPGGVSGTVGVHGGKTYETSTKIEELGVQTIEGVQAEGKRTVTTIPAGAIGNEKPIDVIYERWFSKDLDMIVSSKHSDPRFGDQVFRLTNILRAEPDSSLFTIPADFKVVFDQGFGTAPLRPTPMPKMPAQLPAPGTAPAPQPAPKPKIII